MIADLKQKAAGVDRKRIYTAVGALLIAGVAGHFMQRSATTPVADAPSIAGSAPAASLASSTALTGPVIRPAPDQVTVLDPGTVPGDPAEQADAPVIVDAAPAEVADDDTILANLPEPAPVAPEIEKRDMTAVLEAAPEPALPDPAEVDVTRGEAAPILGVADPQAPEPAAEIPVEPAIASEPAVIEEPPLQFAALDDGVELDLAPAEPAAAGCEPTLAAEAQPGALIALTFTAQCNAGETVDIVADGLRFSEQLGPDGDLVALVPAMSEPALLRVAMPDGQEKAIEVTVPDFGDYERMAIVWKGATGLQLHALENGATYGEPGHVWAEQAGMPEMAIQGAGGFLSVLGSASEGYAADVYTYPAGLMADGAEPDVSIEAQVMENTCGTRIEGQILRSNPFGAPNIEDLAIAVPGCDAVGEYLVLKNLPQDLKLARN